MIKPILSRKQKEWAYAKWCDGYTLFQIADALHCSHRTIQRSINGRPRIRPVLIYDGDGGYDETD